MTDFISSLLTRSFTEQPPLRPRVASLFEPAAQIDSVAAGAGPRSPGSPLEREVEVETEARRSPERQAKAVRSQWPPVANELQRLPSARHAVQPAPPLQGTRATVDEQLREPGVIVPRHATTAVSGEPTAEPVVTLRADAPMIGSVMLLPSSVIPAVTTEPSSEHDSRAQRLVPWTTIPQIVVPRERAETARETQLPTRIPRRQAAAPSMTSSAETTVNVSIGRIEVRATSEAAPPARARAASPVMDLDEYLQRRSRGGKR